MAVDFAVKSSRSSEYDYLPEELEVDPELNGRHDLPDIEPLIKSILKIGQLQCVTIRSDTGKSGGNPCLVAGFSRWRAVAEINKRKLYQTEPLKLRCTYNRLNEQQGFLANIEENRCRNAPTPMDDAYNIQRLGNVYQMKDPEIAEAYGVSLSWVKQRLELLRATPEVEKQIRAGKIKGPAAKAVVKLKKEHQNKLAKVAEEKGKVTPSDIQEVTGVTPAKKEATPVVAPDEEQFSKLVSLAIELARAILADNVVYEEQVKIATNVLRAAGLKE